MKRLSRSQEWLAGIVLGGAGLGLGTLTLGCNQPYQYTPQQKHDLLVQKQNLEKAEKDGLALENSPMAQHVKKTMAPFLGPNGGNAGGELMGIWSKELACLDDTKPGLLDQKCVNEKVTPQEQQKLKDAGAAVKGFQGVFAPYGDGGTGNGYDQPYKVGRHVIMIHHRPRPSAAAPGLDSP